MEINNELNSILMAAYNEAKKRNHEYLTPEHVLYASLYYDSGKSIIEGAGGDIDKLKQEIEDYFKAKVPVITGIEPIQSI